MDCGILGGMYWLRVLALCNTTANGTNGNAIQTGSVDITGGQVTATGTNNGIKATTINIGLTENADLSPSEEFILVSTYDGTVNIYGTDNTLYDAETNVAYQGQPVADNTTIDGRKLVVGLTVAVIGDNAAMMETSRLNNMTCFFMALRI